MERRSGVEPAPSGLGIMSGSGTPAGVVLVVGGAFAFLLLVRAGFRGSIAGP